MTRSTSSRSRGQSYDHGGLIPIEEIFLRPGEQAAVDPGLPLTPDERFRERVAAAWDRTKTLWFREAEHDRLRKVLAAMLVEENQKWKG